MNLIKSLNLEIIDICNLKCLMCDIWKNKYWNFLNEKNIDNILKSKYIDKNTDITITWWEPLLYNNIEKLFKYINDLWFQINTLSTNWILYNKLEKLLTFCINNKIKLPNIHISIDWLEKKHDKQRWVILSFKKSINTIIKLKKIFKNINIKIKYTITNNNIDDIKKIFSLSQKLWVDISFKMVENDINYTNKINVPELLNNKEKTNIINILESIYKNHSNEYINNLLFYIKNNKLYFKCNTPINNLFIMADWEIYCCTKYNSIWNINSNNIDNILFNEKHNKIIDEIENNNCSKCFSLHWAYKTLI